MSRDIQRLPDYLEHIDQAIGRIFSYVSDLDQSMFMQNHMAQDAVIRNFEIIGEASHNIDSHYPEYAKAPPELPLAFAYQIKCATPLHMATLMWTCPSFGSPYTKT